MKKSKQKQKWKKRDESEEEEEEENEIVDETDDSDFEPTPRLFSPPPSRTSKIKITRKRTTSTSNRNKTAKIVKKQRVTTTKAVVTKTVDVSAEELKKKKRVPREKASCRITTVICKLSRISRSPEITEEIKRTCKVMKQVQLEGWHIANLHLNRCYRDDLEIPALDQTFFRHCCGGTFDRKSCAKIDQHLQETIRIYQNERRNIPGYTPPYFEYHSESVNDLALQMKTNAQNMIILHFRKRLTRYLLFKEGLSYKDARKLANIVAFEKDESKVSEEAKAVRKWLGFIPLDQVLKDNMKSAVYKLHEMLTWMEKNEKKFGKEKYFRMYSLLPFSKSFVVNYITIDSGILRDICQRIYKQSGANPLEVPVTDKTICYGDVFQANRQEYMKKAFDVDWAETSVRKFGCRVLTNGYGASIELNIPKDPESVSELPKKYKSKKKTKDSDDSFELERSQLPPNYNPLQLVGIDPGLRTMITSVSEGDIAYTPSSRRVQKKEKFVEMKRLKPRKPRKRKCKQCQQAHKE